MVYIKLTYGINENLTELGLAEPVNDRLTAEISHPDNSIIIVHKTMYHVYPKYLPNSVDPDQTAPKGAV